LADVIAQGAFGLFGLAVLSALPGCFNNKKSVD
jgi:hypothetical protein